MAAGAASVLVISAIWWLALAVLDPDGGREASSPISADNPIAFPASSPSTIQQDGDASGGQDVATAPVDGPYVQAALQHGTFTLSGVVPDAEIAAALLSAAQDGFSPNVRSDLAVDTQLAPVDWLSRTPELISTLTTIEEGTILVSEGTVTVAAKAPSEEEAERFRVSLEETSGLPVTMEAMEITDLPAAIVTLQAANGQVAISGRVPEEGIRDDLSAAAIDAYGPGNVVANLTVDAGVSSARWMRTSETLFGALSAFPNYKIRFEGPSLTGFIGGGAEFQPGAAVVDPSYDPVLEFLHDVMVQDPSLLLVVEGHTDTDGDEAFNQELSQLRADAVAQKLEAAGIEASRITATGKGESFPIAPNDTEEGKSRNRRVELTLAVGTTG